jgi:hypothetical protein
VTCLCKLKHAQTCLYYDQVAWLPFSREIKSLGESTYCAAICLSRLGLFSVSSWCILKCHFTTLGRGGASWKCFTVQEHDMNIKKFENYSKRAYINKKSRSQWPRGLRQVLSSAAACSGHGYVSAFFLCYVVLCR